VTGSGWSPDSYYESGRGIQGAGSAPSYQAAGARPCRTAASTRSIQAVAVQYANSSKELWVRDGIDRAIRVELSREEYEWLEQTAVAVLGMGRPASDLLGAFVLTAKEQLEATGT
jgi:hypothetical protein